MKNVMTHPVRGHGRGFSLVELMIAIFILGFGLIMVITVFPVGGDWTRQATETSVAQAVAQNALGILQSRYIENSGRTALLNVTPGTLMAFPGLGTTILPSEMCYQFGANPPCPADPTKATYFWTALVRVKQSMSQIQGFVGSPTGLDCDVYILVFKKGSPADTFGGSVVPVVNTVLYKPGTYNSITGSVTGAIPQIGEYGINITSGTVFRQVVGYTKPGDPTSAVGVPSSPIPDATVYYAPPADGGATSSPLVYVYQTTISR